MCGVVGIVASHKVSYEIYDALTILQHRGQDAAGMVTCDHGLLNLRKSTGLVKDVFRQHHMNRLEGSMGIGHVRYPTAGTSSSAEAQPMYVNSPFGICLAHNGNLINAQQLSEDLFREDRRHINTSSDSEVLLNVFAHELQNVSGMQPKAKDVFRAITKVHNRVTGAYAVVGLIAGYGVFGFRDPNGIRPLLFGSREGVDGKEYMIASESVALDVLGFKLERDIEPGEAIFIDVTGNVHLEKCTQSSRYSPCIFEYVYLARPDSIMDEVSVYKARLKMGEKLADKILSLYPDHDIDVVIPIPDTSTTAALPMAHRLGVKYREGFVKNRYVGRTFIMPDQKERLKSVKQKFNTIGLEFKDKKVLLVDDSIVRGTTSQQIIRMAREAGASKVYMASAAPPVRFPNVYGIDMPAASEFVANGISTKDIGDYIGADWLVFQDLEDLIQCTAGINPKIEGFDTSVFDGEYVTGRVDDVYLKELEKRRNDGAKNRSSSDEGAEVIELHNQG